MYDLFKRGDSQKTEINGFLYVKNAFLLLNIIWSIETKTGHAFTSVRSNRARKLVRERYFLFFFHIGN